MQCCGMGGCSTVEHTQSVRPDSEGKTKVGSRGSNPGSYSRDHACWPLGKAARWLKCGSMYMEEVRRVVNWQRDGRSAAQTLVAVSIPVTNAFTGYTVTVRTQGVGTVAVMQSKIARTAEQKKDGAPGDRTQVLTATVERAGHSAKPHYG